MELEAQLRWLDRNDENLAAAHLDAAICELCARHRLTRTNSATD
ncbi:hypothetical protein [Novosphingobium aureum]|nr:hypothetical protein [Novosphingobium aureum]